MIARWRQLRAGQHRDDRIRSRTDLYLSLRRCDVASILRRKGRRFRRLRADLIIEIMERHSDIGFESYDCLFPRQDTMQAGSFRNLIALPLQAEPRRHRNSAFVDEQFQPYEYQ